MAIREIPPLTEKDKARFWAKVDKTSSEKGCWLWTGNKYLTGYGQFSVAGRTVSAHRTAYILAGGSFNNGPLVLHGPCNERSCCNPDHLSSGTHEQNQADRDRDGTHQRGERNCLRIRPERVIRGDRHYARLHPEKVLRGEARPSSKLKADQVVEIRLRHSNGEGRTALAIAFNVSRSLIDQIINRRAWSHI